MAAIDKGRDRSEADAWRRRKKESNWHWGPVGLYSGVRFQRKLRPVTQWCVSSPRLSMVPLNGGKNIGEVALGDVSGKSVYPVWKFAQLEVQRPTGVGRLGCNQAESKL